MNAVDHAELKRLADELVQMLAPDQGERAHPAFGHAVRIHNAHAALLSEIEGLKAERDEAMTLDKGFYEWMIERDLLARGEEADWSDIVVALTEHEIECCPDSLRTQAPDSWRPIETAPKDRSWVIAMVSGADDRWEHLNGRAFVIRHDGADDGYDMGWALYPGLGGIPDSWFSGWLPLLPQTAESGK